MTRTLVRMVALLLGQGPQADLLLRQVPVGFPLVSGQTPIAFQSARNEYEIGPQKGRGAHARIRTGDLFLTKEMLYRLSYVGGAAASRFYRAGEATLAARSCRPPSTRCWTEPAAGFRGLMRSKPPLSKLMAPCLLTPGQRPSAPNRARYPAPSRSIALCSNGASTPPRPHGSSRLPITRSE